MEEAASPPDLSQDAASMSTNYPSTSRRVTRILDEMQERIYDIAVSHHTVSCRRVYLKVWVKYIFERLRLLMIARKGAGGLMHRNLRKGLNGWIDLMLRIAAALAQLRAAAGTFRNKELKKVMNTLIARREERQAKLASMRRAALSFIHAALARGWRKLKKLGEQRAKVKRAARSLLYRNQRKGLNGWTFMMVEKARKLLLLRRAAASFAMRAVRKGYNGWLAMRAERLLALGRMNHAALCFVQRAVRRGFRAWLPLLRERELHRRAAASFLYRNRRKGFNGWLSMIARRHALLSQMGGSASALKNHAFRACFNTWSEVTSELKSALVAMRSAVRVMLGGKVRAAFNSLAGRAQVAASQFAAFEAAGQRWALMAVRSAFMGMLAYADAQKALPEGAQLLRPLSPGAKKRVQWARTRARHAPVRELAADDKNACQRALLAPHAALVLRYDGAVFRVAGVHRFPKEAVCSVDLVRGYDDLLLTELPNEVRSDMGPTHQARLQQAIAGGGVVRISAAALSPPEHVLVVPGFFGSTLKLVNKLDVRVIDARFEPSKQPFTGFEPPGEDQVQMVLTTVLLTLIDVQSNEAVGRPSWTPLLEVLDLLPDDRIVVAESAGEEELRRRRRIELHRQEQRRLALHHLRIAARRGGGPLEAWGDGLSSTSQLMDEPFASSGGVGALMRQMLGAAPSKMLAEVEGIRLGGGGGGTGHPLIERNLKSGVGPLVAPARSLVASSSAKAFTAGYDDSRSRGMSPPRGKEDSPPRVLPPKAARQLY